MKWAFPARFFLSQATAIRTLISPMDALDQDLEQEIAAIAESAGCELLAVDFKGGVLQVVIDHPEGVRLEHCETVSRQTSALLDVADWGRDRYTLEVTSPGLDRKLYRPRDYARFTGEVVRVTYHPADGKRTVVGVLEGCRPEGDPETIRVSTDHESIEIPLSSIETARLVPQFSQP